MLFTGPLADPIATVSTLERYRTRDFGTAFFDRIEIVRLERSRTDAQIVPLRTLHLGD